MSDNTGVHYLAILVFFLAFILIRVARKASLWFMILLLDLLLAMTRLLYAAWRSALLILQTLSAPQ